MAVRLCAALFFFFISGTLLAQTKVTGNVKNAKDNSPVAFATVTVKGTTIATTTSTTGDFVINVPSGKNTLVVSSVGFDDSEVPIGTGTVAVVLKEKVSSLDEIVVTGYTAQKKKSLTGSVAIVNVKDLKAVPAGSPEQMLQGRASGVTVNTTGQPGSSSDIRIRGITSFGDVSPLVIIDGVQGNLHDINANDIESFQVLKDAGAASIYGVRGSNGVIVITTKKGKSGKPTITYDGYYGTQRPLQGNVFNLLNTPEMAEVTWLSLRNSGQLDTTTGNPTHPQYGNGTQPEIPDYILIGSRNGVVGQPTPEELAQYNIDYNKGDIYQIVGANKTGTDWYHELFTPAPIQSHTISASGGGDRSTYLFSLGYFNQEGTYLNTYLKRYDVRINTTFNIKNNIRIGENAYIYAKDNPQIGILGETDIGALYREQPIIPIYDYFGGWAGTRAAGLGNSWNPYANAVKRKDDKGHEWDITGNVFAEVDFLRHFTVRTSFGGLIRNGYYYSFGFHDYENAENNTSNSFNENAYYDRSYTWTNTIAYNAVFGKHDVKVLGGLEAIDNYGRGVGGTALGLFSNNPDYRVLSNGSSGFTNYSNAYQNSLYSQFGKVDYAYSNKYLVSATVRRDGSSRFGPENRWGVFPAFSAGWVITQESFMQGVSWLNNLKLRGSWGKLGNQLNVDPTNAFNLYGSSASNANFGSYYDINGSNTSSVQGFTQTRIGNVKTGWEEDKLINVGLDAIILKNKLDFSIEWYKKSINGLLFTDQVPAMVGGATRPVVNIGDIENKGWDFSAAYHGNAGKDFKFDISANLTTYKSKIISIPGDYFDASSGGTRLQNQTRNQVGHPIGAFFGYKVVGLFQSQEDVDKSPKQDAAAPGRFKYLDANGDGQINPDDRVFMGDPNPEFTYGINLNASYKGFDFSAFFYGSKGNDVFNYVRYWVDFYPSFQGVKSKDLLYNSWTPDRPNAKTPIAENESNFSNNGVTNSYYIENGSFLKCKSMILGYTIPSAKLKRIGLDRFRVYVQAANLFTITDYTGQDPEVTGTNSSFGIDYGTYPNNQKMYIVGINLSF
ncbi:MAG TPA: TonB-dependent receptor [Chitinophagaceae bacterium]